MKLAVIIEQLVQNVLKTHQATCAVAVVFACSSWSLQLLAFAHWMKKKKRQKLNAIIRQPPIFPIVIRRLSYYFYSSVTEPLEIMHE